MGLNPQQKYKIVAENIKNALAEHGFLLLPDEATSLTRTISYAVLGDLFTLSIATMANASQWFRDAEQAQGKISNEAFASVLELALRHEKLLRARMRTPGEHDTRVFMAMARVIDSYRSEHPPCGWPELALNTSAAAADAFKRAEATGCKHNGALLLTAYVAAALTAMPGLGPEDWKRDVIVRADEPGHFRAGLDAAIARLKRAGVFPWA